MTYESIFLAKAAALLHDPPQKCWYLREHEKCARELAALLLEGTALKKVSDIFKNETFDDEARCILESSSLADNVAASIDRYLLNSLCIDLETGRYFPDLFRQEVLCLKNIIDPRFNYALPSGKSDVDHILKARLSDFANVINCILRELPSEKLCWHVLYSLYELMWYVHFQGIVSPADTRVPTHTIFDHLYASASMVNWTYSSQVCGESGEIGYLIVVDLAGVQNFIAASRKLRDLWFSSWLASALLWATIWPLVRELGPDIVLSPTTRLNPFYFQSLLVWLKRELGEKYHELLANETKLLEVIGALFEDLEITTSGFPVHPVIPVTARLILPALPIVSDLLKKADLPVSLKNNEDLVNFIINQYKTKWTALVDYIIHKVEKECSEDRLINALSKLGIFNILRDACKKWRIFDSPPLPIRVLILPVRTSLQELRQKGPLLFDDFLQKLTALEKDAKYQAKVLTPSASTSVHEWSRDSWLQGFPYKQHLHEAFWSKKGFDYCTCCGISPAIISMPSEHEYGAVINDLCGDHIAELLSIYFSPGERLCPYCLIKRIATLPEVLCGIIELLFEGLHVDTRELLKRDFPAVSDIACIEAKRSLCELGDAVYDLWWNEVRKSSGRLQDIVKSFLKRRVKRSYYPEHQLVAYCESNEKYELACILCCDSEVLFLSNDARSAFKRFKLELKRRTPQLAAKFSPPRTYYALIRADADNLGRLFTGFLYDAACMPEDSTQDAEQFLSKYFVECCASPSLRSLVENVLKGDLKKSIAILKDELSKRGIILPESKITTQVQVFANFLRKFINERRIPLTPSMYFSLCMSLMATALFTCKVVSKDSDGFVVYAGGDDLLCLVPVDKSLNAVLKSRYYFSLGNSREHVGFYEIVVGPQGQKAVFQALPIAGRSYSVIYAHYRTPLSLVLIESSNLLELLAKKACWRSSSSTRPLGCKDSSVLSYMPRGALPCSAVIPNKLLPASSDDFPRNVVNELTNISALNLLERLILDLIHGHPSALSHSFVQDFFGEFFPDPHRSILTQASARPEVLKALLRRIFIRNASRPLDQLPEKIVKLFNRYFEELLPHLSLHKAVGVASPALDVLGSFDDSSFDQLKEVPLLYLFAKSTKVLDSSLREVL